MIRGWSESDISFLANNYDKLTHKEIAAKVNKTTRCVKSYCQRHGFITKCFKYEINEKFFDSWSSNMAWVLGFTMSDGCVEYRTDISRFRLIYSIQKRDVEVLNFINNCLETNKPFNEYNGILNAKYTSKYMVDRLMQLGIIPRKTGFESIPQELPDEYFWDFLRGYFDGDGWISSPKSKPRTATFSICSSNDFILKQIQSKINMGKIINRARWRNNVDFFNLNISKQEHLKYIYNNMYKNSQFKLNRKFDIFNEYIKRLS